MRDIGITIKDIELRVSIGLKTMMMISQVKYF